jgi:hypothetical protein
MHHIKMKGPPHYIASERIARAFIAGQPHYPISFRLVSSIWIEISGYPICRMFWDRFTEENP